MKPTCTNHLPRHNRPWRLCRLLFISTMLLATSACARPLQVEPEQVRLVEATVTALAGKDLKSLETILHEVERAARSKALSPRQKERFQSICGDARAGRWKAAEDAAYDFLHAQRP